MWSVIGSIIGWAFVVWLAVIFVGSFIRARGKNLRDLTQSHKDEEPKP
jgi:hypothetical protein